MAIKTKIKIKNGKWEINGKTLTEYKGDRKVIDALLMSTFRINSIQTPVSHDDFKPKTEPKVWKSIEEVIATVNRPILKAQNYKFRKRNEGNPLQDFMDAHPNISTMSFARALGEE
jgi:hypothetical protein